LGGATGLDLNGTVDVNTGNLTVEDSFTAAGDLLGSGNVTLAGGTLDGAASQRVDAEGGALTAASTLTKNGAGNLNLGGAAGIDLNGTVDVNTGNLTVEDSFTAAGDLLGSGSVNVASGTLDGGASQRVDAEGGALIAGALTKNGAGNLTLGGATGLDLNGTVDVNTGNLTVEDTFTAAGNLLATGNVNLPSGTLDGGASQRVDAEGGALSAGALTKSGNGDLVLAGATAIDLNGAVDVDADDLVIEDAFTAAADLTAASDVALQGAGTLDGGASQRVDAQTGVLTAASTLTKNGAGNLNLGGAAGIDLNGTVDVNTGNLAVENTFTAAGDLLASSSVSLAGGTLYGPTSQRIDAEGGTLTASALTKNGAGNLTLGGATGLDLNGTVDVNTGNLAVEDTFTAAGDLLGSGNVTLPGGTLDGGAQRVDAEGGALDANGSLNKTTGGDLVLGGSTALLLGADVTTPGATGADSLRLEDAATLDGGSQRIDAMTGTLNARETLSKTTEGNLTLAGNTAIRLGGDVRTPGASDEDTLTFEDTASFDRSGPADQTVDAGEGAIAVAADLLKVTAGALAVQSDSTIGFTGEGDQLVDAQDGDVTLEASEPNSQFSSIFKESGHLTIVASGANDVTTLSKISVADGDLTIASAGTVQISDLAASGTIRVTAAQISLDSRDPGPSFDVGGNLVQDFDADFVGSQIDFNVTPSGSGSFVFGTPNGTEVSAPIQNSQFLKRALTTSGDLLTSSAFEDPSGSVRDLAPAGGSTDDPASDIAAVLADLAIEPTAPALADASAVGPTRADDVLIFLECFPLEGQTEDLPEACDPEEYGVAAAPEVTPPVGAPVATPAAVPENVAVAPVLGSAARPATTPQMNALRIYRDLRAKPVVPVLGDAVAEYKSATGVTQVKGAEFRRYVEGTPSQAEAVGYLNSMRSMVGELRQAGMTPAQFLRAAQKVVEEMTPEGITSAELGVAIEAGGQAGWPPLWLEQEEVAELLGDASR
jgi:hypothetical protein